MPTSHVDLNWTQIAEMAQWDCVVRINADGTAVLSNTYAAPLYFDPTSGASELDLNAAERSEYRVTQFHTSETLEPHHYKHHLSEWTDEGYPVEFYLTAVTGLSDSELVGWALVIHDISGQVV